MSATRQLCDAAGMTVAAAAKKARLHPRYLAHCVNHGCKHEATIQRLSRLLNCEETVFINGYDYWKRTFGHNREAVRSVSVKDPLPVSQKDRQRHILKLI